MLVGIAGMSSYCTALGGACLFVTGVTKSYAVLRWECGDGGREDRKKAKEANAGSRWNFSMEGVNLNPVSFCRRIYDEDKLSVYIWTGIYIGINIALFVYTMNLWYGIVGTERSSVIDGTVAYSCTSDNCALGREIVKWGPITYHAAWAKGFGALLNLNCSLILLPVVRLFLRKINNAGESFTVGADRSTFAARYCAHPLTRYIPLSKNLEFHKLCAFTVFVAGFLHSKLIIPGPCSVYHSV
jgi:hypothetical protein